MVTRALSKIMVLLILLLQQVYLHDNIKYDAAWSGKIKNKIMFRFTPLPTIKIFIA